MVYCFKKYIFGRAILRALFYSNASNIYILQNTGIAHVNLHAKVLGAEVFYKQHPLKGITVAFLKRLISLDAMF